MIGAEAADADDVDPDDADPDVVDVVRCRVSAVGTDGVTVRPVHVPSAPTDTGAPETGLPPTGVVTGTKVVFGRPVPLSETLPFLATNSDRVVVGAGDVTSGTTVVVEVGVDHPWVEADHV